MNGKWVRWFSGCASILFSLGVAGAAQAVTGSWVLNGSTVNYAGTNQLRIGAGEVNTGGVNAAMAGGTVNVGTEAGIIWAGGSMAQCPANNVSLLAASSVFYIYYDPTTTQLVASPVPPNEDGIPISNLFFTVAGVCNTPGVAAASYVYLGSFITMANNQVAPFERFGDQVSFPYLNPSGWLPEVTLSWNNNAVLTVNLHTLATPWVWPVTASALDIEQTIQNTDNQNHVLFMLDANWGIPVTPANCALAGAHLSQNNTDRVLLQPGEYVPGLREWWSPSTSGGTSITYTICDAAFGATPVNVILDYRGYREMVHHLDQPR